MYFMCTEEFETREDGYPFTFEKGTVWEPKLVPPTLGGDELMLMNEVSDGDSTSVQATVRAYRLSTSFKMLSPDDFAMPGWCSKLEAQ